MPRLRWHHRVSAQGLPCLGHVAGAWAQRVVLGWMQVDVLMPGQDPGCPWLPRAVGKADQGKVSQLWDGPKHPPPSLYLGRVARGALPDCCCCSCCWGSLPWPQHSPHGRAFSRPSTVLQISPVLHKDQRPSCALLPRVPLPSGTSQHSHCWQL